MENVLHLIEQYGYLLVFFGVMAESTGVPLPGETILISAGIVAQRGHLDLVDAILFGILGAVVGDQIGYWIGREGGRPFVLRFCHSHAEPYLTGGVSVLEAAFSPLALLLASTLAGFVLLLLARRRHDFETAFSGVVPLATALDTVA